MTLNVILRPTRTRMHTKTPDDFVNDFYVPRTSIEAVSLSQGSNQRAGQRLLAELYEEIPARHATPYQLTVSWANWKRSYGQAVLNAISDDLCPFEGDPTSKSVWIVSRTETYRAWDGKAYTQLFAIQAYSDEASARNYVPGARGVQIVKKSLLP